MPRIRNSASSDKISVSSSSSSSSVTPQPSSSSSSLSPNPSIKPSSYPFSDPTASTTPTKSPPKRKSYGRSDNSSVSPSVSSLHSSSSSSSYSSSSVSGSVGSSDSQHTALTLPISTMEFDRDEKIIDYAIQDLNDNSNENNSTKSMESKRRKKRRIGRFIDGASTSASTADDTNDVKDDNNNGDDFDFNEDDDEGDEDVEEVKGMTSDIYTLSTSGSSRGLFDHFSFLTSLLSTTSNSSTSNATTNPTNTQLKANTSTLYALSSILSTKQQLQNARSAGCLSAVFMSCKVLSNSLLDTIDEGDDDDESDLFVDKAKKTKNSGTSGEKTVKNEFNKSLTSLILSLAQDTSGLGLLEKCRVCIGGLARVILSDCKVDDSNADYDNKNEEVKVEVVVQKQTQSSDPTKSGRFKKKRVGAAERGKANAKSSSSSSSNTTTTTTTNAVSLKSTADKLTVSKSIFKLLPNQAKRSISDLQEDEATVMKEMGGRTIALMALTKIIVNSPDDDSTASLTDEKSMNCYSYAQENESSNSNSEEREEEELILKNNLKNEVLLKSGSLPLLAKSLGWIIDEFLNSAEHNKIKQIYVTQNLILMLKLIDAICCQTPLNSTENRRQLSRDGTSPSLVLALVKLIFYCDTNSKGSDGNNEMLLVSLRCLTSVTHDNALASEQLSSSSLPSPASASASSKNGITQLFEVFVNITNLLKIEISSNKKIKNVKDKKMQYFDQCVFILNTLANIIECCTVSTLGRDCLMGLSVSESESGEEGEGGSMNGIAYLTTWVKETLSSVESLLVGPSSSSSSSSTSSKEKEKDQNESEFIENETEDSIILGGNGCILLGVLLRLPSDVKLSVDVDLGRSSGITGVLGSLFKPFTQQPPPSSSSSSSSSSEDQITETITTMLSKKYIASTLNAFLNVMETRVGAVSLGLGDPVILLITELRK